MSVTITITDPTEEEARRVADYLMELTAAPVPPPFVANVAPVSPDPTAAFASIPVVPAAPCDVELDSAGLPWDGRIHSDTKSKIGDGTWRTRRGADPAVVAAVTAELKAAMAAPKAMGAPALSIPTPPAPAAVPVPPPFVASAAPSVPPVPTTPAAGSAGAAPTASPSEAPPVSIAITTFPQLMMAITKGIAKGTFTQSDVVKAIEGVGLASIPMLASRPDLIPAVAVELGV